MLETSEYGPFVDCFGVVVGGLLDDGLQWEVDGGTLSS